jgi:PPM family protein phosphatase
VPVVTAALTDLGLRRPANEDTLVIRPELGLFVVCDGMGGHAAGEIASRVAADAVEAFVQRTDGVGEDFAWPFTYRREWGLDGNRLASALLLANRAIAQRVQDEPALRGMATTAVCLLLGTRGLGLGAREEHASPPAPSPQPPAPSLPALVAHVGDSRAYIWHGGGLDQITRDHSWVEEQIALGILSEDEARQHPWRNLVTRALAGAEEPIVELTPLTLEAGDRVLLCSDGLSSPLTNGVIAGIVGQAPAGRPEELCRALVDAANAAGGPDNITVVVIEIA